MDLTNSPGHLNHQFAAEDAAILRPATEFTPEDMNGPMNELVNLIIGAGLVPSAGNHSQVLEAVRLLLQRGGNYAIDTGIANAYVIAMNPAITAYSDGLKVRVKIANDNLDASTLNAGAGACALVNDVGGALAAGDLQAGSVVEATYVASSNKFYITSMVGGQALASFSGLGYGQTWQVVTRNSGTIYYNTTGKPIVWILKLENPGTAHMFVGGIDVTGGTGLAMNGSAVSTSVIVPPDAEYYCTVAGAAYSSTELR